MAHDVSLPENWLEEWKANQFLLVKQIIPLDLIHRCRQIFANVTDDMIQKLKADNVITDTGDDLPFETRFARVAGKHAGRFGRGWRKPVAQRPIFDLHRVPALVDIAEKILGGEVLGHPVFNARPKLPDQQLTVVPWHQDSSYFGDMSAKSLILSAWVPFVPVNANNGCLQIERDSFHRGLLPHRVEALEGQFLEIPPENVNESNAVTVPMEMGDVLLFSNLVTHRSLPNRSDMIRWSIDIRFHRAGDEPGAIGWGDPNFQWVIRSGSRPETTYEAWKEKTEAFGW